MLRKKKIGMLNYSKYIMGNPGNIGGGPAWEANTHPLRHPCSPCSSSVSLERVQNLTTEEMVFALGRGAPAILKKFKGLGKNLSLKLVHSVHEP